MQRKRAKVNRICSNCSEIVQGSNKCRFDECTASFCTKCWLRCSNGLCTTHRQRKPDEQTLIEACQGGRIDQARQLLRSGANVNSQDSSGSSALMMTCSNGQIDTARMLLGEFHANIEIQDTEGDTALTAACLDGQIDTARMLLGEFHAGLVAEHKPTVIDPTSSDISQVASVCDDKTIGVWDAESGLMLGNTLTNPVSANFRQLSCSRDGHNLASQTHKSISIWRVNSDSTLDSIKNIENSERGSIVSLCLNYDGSRVASGHHGYICYWNAFSGEMLWCGYCRIAVHSIDISCDGALVVFCGSGRLVRLCSTESGEKLCIFRGHTDLVRSVKFNNDASRIASWLD